MMPRSRLSPTQLAMVAGVGSFSSAIYFVVAMFVVERHTHGSVHSVLCGSPWMRLLLLVPSIGGIAVSLWARGRLGRGANKLLWTEAELARLRMGLQHPIWKILSVAVIGLYFVPIILGSSHAIWIYIMIAPVQLLGSMKQMVSPRSKPAETLGLRTFAPLQSEHWGRT